ncbi:cleavage and polyadenylation specificity factor subunit 5 [Sporobolomyces salmoneus]|uniref:cleavage and polyadenylation specificity factor subunit 5 n=1 Tax=Sporobolomyces salmoneus TaxID=183962 RepID=UPI0031748FC2
MNTLTIYPLSNYSFATKEAQIDEDPSVNARLQRLEDDYEKHGMRRTVEGLLIVHEHGHPHVLLLQVANSFFKLPGDYLKPGEGEIDGLKKRMHQRLGPETDSGMGNGWEVKGEKDWEIADAVGQFYRPNFEGFMYPYIPAHISKPKEIKTWYLVQLPHSQVLTVPRNMKLIALPLFELYDNAVRYGPQLAAIPHLLSRINFIFEN